MDERDIYRNAKLYNDLYGPNASVRAAIGAEALFRADDLEGYAVWMRIGRAIEELQATAGETKH